MGWICALPVEFAAAKGMLDEEHSNPQMPPSKADSNSYLLGSIGKFKVVVACLPLDQLGAASAAICAKEMLFTFPKICVGLLVGIGVDIPGVGDSPDFHLGEYSHTNTVVCFKTFFGLFIICQSVYKMSGT